MNITVRRLKGNSFECVYGHARLRAALQVMGKVTVQDIETMETFDVHEVEGQIVILDDGRNDRANTIAAQVLTRVSQI